MDEKKGRRGLPLVLWTTAIGLSWWTDPRRVRVEGNH